MSVTVLEPSDARMAAATLASASRDQGIIVPRGSGTKLSWRDGGPPGAYLSTRLLQSPVEHYAGDLVATIPSGTTLADANAILSRSGQWLPLDPPHGDRATIGGIVATNDSGPRRQKFGAPRDLIIGIEVALTDGRLAKAGGRVVKNVAGYDLSRLMCGSFGSLAVITSATFKLAPIPATSRTVVARMRDLPQAIRIAQMLANAPLTPSAIEIEAPSPRVIVRFESTERAAEQMAMAAHAIFKDGDSTDEMLDSDRERDLWRGHETEIWDKPGLVLKISVLPTDVAGLFTDLARLDKNLEWSLTGRVALGILFLRVNGDLASQRQLVIALRRYATDRGGTLAVLEAPEAIRQELASKDNDDGVRGVMHAVKARFDPQGILPPIPDC